MRIFSLFSIFKKRHSLGKDIIIHMPFTCFFPFSCRFARKKEETRVKRYIFIMLQRKDDKSEQKCISQIDIIHLAAVSFCPFVLNFPFITNSICGCLMKKEGKKRVFIGVKQWEKRWKTGRFSEGMQGKVCVSFKDCWWLF